LRRQRRARRQGLSRRQRLSRRQSPSRTSPRATSPKRPLNVAITGGIGAGKSEALRAFGRHGAATISSDEIVHELIEDDPEVKGALLERYGTTKRSDIAAVVFSDRDELAWLEALLHPRVVTHYLAWRERQTAPLTVTEVPLLYETGGDERFDKVVVITAPRALREARREPLPGDRETRLIDDKEKAKRADYAYVNTGSLEELDRFVGSVVENLIP
jgi:dephospho-CoA kinase